MPSPNWRHLLTVSGLLAFFSVAALAQTSSLEGDVKDEDGKPLQNALVKIERKDIKGNYQVKTNKKGHWFHAGLPLGVYKVSLEVNGKVADFVDNVRTKFAETEKVDFNLAEVKARQTAAAAGVQLTQEQARQMTPEQRRQIEEATKKRQEQLSKNKVLNDAFNAGMEAMRAAQPSPQLLAQMSPEERKRFEQEVRPKQWAAAIESFNKAVELDPKQHVVWAQLAESQMQLASTKPLNEQQAGIAKALENYLKALELKPEDAAYHNNYGLALARIQKFNEAQAELAKAAQLDPPNAGRYFFNLGAILVNIGQADQAYEAFKKAIAADLNYADAHYQVGVYLLSKAQVAPDGKVTPAPGTIEAFQKYLELKPTGPYVESAKGSLQALTGSVQTQFSTKPQKKSRK